MHALTLLCLLLPSLLTPLTASSHAVDHTDIPLVKNQVQARQLDQDSTFPLPKLRPDTILSYFLKRQDDTPPPQIIAPKPNPNNNPATKPKNPSSSSDGDDSSDDGGEGGEGGESSESGEDNNGSDDGGNEGGSEPESPKKPKTDVPNPNGPSSVVAATSSMLGVNSGMVTTTVAVTTSTGLGSGSESSSSRSTTGEAGQVYVGFGLGSGVVAMLWGGVLLVGMNGI